MFREPIEEPEKDEELEIKAEDDIETMLQNAADFTWPNRLLILALKEIQYLRKAGDALAKGVRNGHWDDALDAWTELRGG